MLPPHAPRASRFTLTRHPFFRSYGANLPSSLTRVISSALAFSARLPVSVYGTVTPMTGHKSFSWKRSLDQFAFSVDPAPHNPSSPFTRELQAWTHTSNRALIQLSPSSCTHNAIKVVPEYLTGCPSPTLFSLGLGPTNPERINLPQETLDLRRIRFSRIFSLLIPA